jgi:hypothetical protein
MKNIFFAVIFGVICIYSQIFAQVNRQNNIPFIFDFRDNTPESYVNQILDYTFFPKINKSPGHYSRQNWQAIIDSLWGPGLPTSDKLIVFDKFWKTIDSSFACFHNIYVNWDSLKTIYRAEIQNGVSKGRFCAIINHLSYWLKEGHTHPYDIAVFSTAVTRGVPVFQIGGWGNSGASGIGTTPLPDSSLLIYYIIPNHPLGLQRGDIVLGYDRIKWKYLVKELLDYQLPIKGWWGSSPTAHTHSLLMCANRNWHLFDTMDVVKFSTHDTVHLSTLPLQNQTNNVYCSEQMDIPGVPKPASGQYVSYGIVTGTNIGYIYNWGLTGDVSAQLKNAVSALLQTDGLIIDLRMNMGGNMFLSDSALKLLFSNNVTTIDWGVRCSPSVHQQMCALNSAYGYRIPGTPPGYYKPIAVLTGPGALSSGDQVSLRFKYHPRTRFFGKSTSTAFNSPITLTLHSEWSGRYSPYDAYEMTNPGVYLTHKEFTVDENVWLTPAIVAQGRDDVVEAAIKWINLFCGNDTTLLSDNAESGFSKWTTNEGWGTSSTYYNSPSHSFTDSPSGNYVSNADNSMTLINPINVSALDGLVLSFWNRFETETDIDFCNVEVSSNNGVNWQKAYSYSGNMPNLHQVKIDITKFANKSANMKIRFRLVSDGNNNFDGWYIDDIELKGYRYQNVGISGNTGNNLPMIFSLEQNYPNPFNPVTKINFSIPKNENVILKVFDITGRVIDVLINRKMDAGTYSFDYNAEHLSSGVYFYQLICGDFIKTKKMILLK